MNQAAPSSQEEEAGERADTAYCLHRITNGKLIRGDDPDGPIMRQAEHQVTGLSAGFPPELHEACAPDRFFRNWLGVTNTVSRDCPRGAFLYRPVLIDNGGAVPPTYYGIFARLQARSEAGESEPGRRYTHCAMLVCEDWEPALIPEVTKLLFHHDLGKPNTQFEDDKLALPKASVLRENLDDWETKSERVQEIWERREPELPPKSGWANSLENMLWWELAGHKAMGDLSVEDGALAAAGFMQKGKLEQTGKWLSFAFGVQSGASGNACPFALQLDDGPADRLVEPEQLHFWDESEPSPRSLLASARLGVEVARDQLRHQLNPRSAASGEDVEELLADKDDVAARGMHFGDPKRRNRPVKSKDGDATPEHGTTSDGIAAASAAAQISVAQIHTGTDDDELDAAGFDEGDVADTMKGDYCAGNETIDESDIGINLSDDREFHFTDDDDQQSSARDFEDAGDRDGEVAQGAHFVDCDGTEEDAAEDIHGFSGQGEAETRDADPRQDHEHDWGDENTEHTDYSDQETARIFGIPISGSRDEIKDPEIIESIVDRNRGVLVETDLLNGYTFTDVAGYHPNSGPNRRLFNGFDVNRYMRAKEQLFYTLGNSDIEDLFHDTSGIFREPIKQHINLIKCIYIFSLERDLHKIEYFLEPALRSGDKNLQGRRNFFMVSFRYAVHAFYVKNFFRNITRNQPITQEISHVLKVGLKNLFGNTDAQESYRFSKFHSEYGKWYDPLGHANGFSEGGKKDIIIKEGICSEVLSTLNISIDDIKDANRVINVGYKSGSF